LSAAVEPEVAKESKKEEGAAEKKEKNSCGLLPDSGIPEAGMRRQDITSVFWYSKSFCEDSN